MILELVPVGVVVHKSSFPVDLFENLSETIRVLALLVLQRGLEPRPLGRAPPESCPDGVAAVEIPAAAARHGRPETSLVVDRVVVVVLVQRVTAEFYLTEGLALLEEGDVIGVHGPRRERIAAEGPALGPYSQALGIRRRRNRIRERRQCDRHGSERNALPIY